MNTFERLDEDAKKALSPEGDLGPVRRITLEELSRSDLRSFDAPVVITDLVATWPARDRWTLSYLRERVGNPLVSVGTLPPDHEYRYDLAKEVPFHDLCQALEASPQKERWYLAAARVWSVRSSKESPFTQLAPDVPPPSFVTAGMLDSIHMWLGYDGVASSLHYDMGDNFLSVISGKKHLLLFAPSETKHLYPHSPFGDKYCFHSRVGFRDFDAKQFPDVRKARYWRISLSPGETIFMPRHFWHYVVSEGLSIAVNSWFETAKPKRRDVLKSPLREVALQDNLRALKRRARRLFGLSKPT